MQEQFLLEQNFFTEQLVSFHGFGPLLVTLKLSVSFVFPVETLCLLLKGKCFQSSATCLSLLNRKFSPVGSGHPGALGGA